MKIKYLIIFSFVTQLILGQDKIIYSSNNILLCLDLRFNTYKIWEEANLNEDTVGTFIKEKPDVSLGNLFIDNDLITCIDTISKDKIVLKKIDKYRLIAINKSHCFRKNEILYAVCIYDRKGRPEEFMKWLNGKRHGTWLIHSRKGINYIIYDNGKIIEEYFKTNKEAFESPDNSPARL